MYPGARVSVYDFRNLSPVEFEELAGDLLSRTLGVRLERFATGRDGGIDLRYAPSDDAELIVQCKHWPESSAAKLQRHMVKDELPKVEALAPGRYILATSVRLSPQAKERLAEVLAPWLHGTADIYGPDDLNALLREHPDVERSNVKLWLNSEAVLQRALNAEVFNRTAMLLTSIE